MEGGCPGHHCTFLFRDEDFDSTCKVHVVVAIHLVKGNVFCGSNHNCVHMPHRPTGTLECYISHA